GAGAPARRRGRTPAEVLLHRVGGPLHPGSEGPELPEVRAEGDVPRRARDGSRGRGDAPSRRYRRLPMDRRRARPRLARGGGGGALGSDGGRAPTGRPRPIPSGPSPPPSSASPSTSATAIPTGC